ncbi:hypothetical protein INT44_005284, partial [Umbelopsis vinacea]
MPIFSKKITPTSITADIDQATNPTQQELDWGLVVQISEAINKTDLGAKEARKLLQKKITSNNVETQVLGFQLLKTLSEAAPQKFHDQLIAKSFIEDLNKLASNKASDARVHGAMIDALQSWASQYRQDSSMDDLLRIHDRLTADPVGTHGRSPRTHRAPQEPSVPREEDIPGDIELAKNNCQVLSQTLSFTDPNTEDITKNALIQEFYGKCKDLHTTIMHHLQTASDPDTISSLLDTNSELVNAFKTYDDMLERSALQRATSASTEDVHAPPVQEGQQQQIQQQQTTTMSREGDALAAPYLNERTTSATLIDFGAPTPTQEYPPSSLSQQVPTNNHNSDPFDPFSDNSQVHEDQQP